MLSLPSARDLKTLHTTGNVCHSLTLTWLQSVVCYLLAPLRDAVLMWSLTGWFFSTHHAEHHPLSLVALQNPLCSVQLLELKQHGDFIVSQINIRSHQVNYSKRSLNQQGLFWRMWFCTGHRWFFWPTSFFPTCHFSTCNYFKTTLSWQILFIIWQGREIFSFQKESWKMLIGWNYTTVPSAKEWHST